MSMLKKQFYFKTYINIVKRLKRTQV